MQVKKQTTPAPMHNDHDAVSANANQVEEKPAAASSETFE